MRGPAEQGGGGGAERAVERLASVRWLFLWIALLPMLFSSLLVAGIGYANSLGAVREAADRLFAETATRLASRMGAFLAAAGSINSVNAEALRTGDLRSRDLADAEGHLLALLRAFPGVSSVYLGSPEGGLIDAGREGPSGSEYFMETSGLVAGPLAKYAIDGRGRKSKLLSSFARFDARERPWYRAALERRGGVWTDVFPLFTGQDSAISESSPVYDAEGRLLAVVSVDLFISQLADLVRELDQESGGLSCIVDDEDLLVASAADWSVFTPQGGGRSRRLSAAESADPRLSAAAAALDGRRVRKEEPAEFRLGSLAYLAAETSLAEPAGLDWRIISVFPAEHFRSPLRNLLRESLLSLLAALLIVGFLAVPLTSPLVARAREFSAFADAVAEGRWRERGLPRASRIREIEKLRGDLLAMGEKLQAQIDELREEIRLRTASEAALAESKREKELLLLEVHHRIKNNMGAMMSLLSMQGGASEDPKVRAALVDAESRLASMMLLYGKLYRSESVSRTDAGAYLGEIAEAVAAQYPSLDRISLEKDLASLPLDASILMPLGILANELLTNAYKHAFPDGREGRIRIVFRAEGEELLLLVEDDGVGFDAEKGSRGFGSHVVEGLAVQLQGRLEVSTQGGSRFELRLPLPKGAAGGATERA